VLKRDKKKRAVGPLGKRKRMIRGGRREKSDQSKDFWAIGGSTEEGIKFGPRNFWWWMRLSADIGMKHLPFRSS